MKQQLGPWALVTQLGLSVVATLLIALFLGMWLDSVLGTRPWLTLILSLIGVVAATINVYRLVTRSLNEVAPAPGKRPERDGDEEEEEDEDEWPNDRPHRTSPREEADEPQHDDSEDQDK